MAAAAPDPVERSKEARDLYDQGRFDEALLIWEEILKKHKKQEVVTGGDAHWYASRCMRQMGGHAEAAAMLETYLKSFPNGKGVFTALTGTFHSWVEAGEEKKAKAAGKRLFKAYPDAKGTFWVFRTYLERGWKLPRLATEYRVLYYWTFDRINAAENPDLRLAALDLIAAWHKKEKLVKSGAILFCQAWCHQKSGRHDKAIEIGTKHLKHYPKASERDKVRMTVAEAMLAKDPPDIKRATKVLEALIRNPGRYKEPAEKMLAAAKTGGTSIQILKGCPRPEGMGKIVLLTDLSASSSRFKALEVWRTARDAEVVRIRPGRLSDAVDELRRLGPEFVAIAVAPLTIDGNFHLSVLEFCRDLDEDPMPDFNFGYLVSRDAKDLAAFTAAILEKEKQGGRAAAMVGVPSSGGQIKALDYFLHFGHGTPRKIVKGLSAKGIADLDLPRGPVVFSGACFNGVCSRSYERSLLEYVYMKPEEIPPEDTVSLAWIHAGATGVIAALDGDRGEMANAEWEYFRESADTLGGVIGHQYRLVFACLAESYSSFPRYLPGKSKRTSFFDVMLRGKTSRLLIGDPMYRPLKKPLDDPTMRAGATVEDGKVKVTIEVLRFAPGPFTNILTRKPGPPWRERRLYARVALPEGLEGMLGRPEVRVTGARTDRTKVRHEIWGGRRYIHVLLESTDGKLTSPGTSVELTFQVSR